MSAKELRVGIAGYGVVGKRRQYFIDQHPFMRTVAVCDKDFVQPCRRGEIKCFSHFKELLDESLDVLFVCLPNYLAAEVTIAGLENGLHVFCEKPPGRDVADVERVIEAEGRHPDLVLKYGFNHRYHDSVQEALRLIRSGFLGEIINMRGVYGKSKILSYDGNWRAERRYAGGGILLDQGIHLVDLMTLFSGRFTEVQSFVSNQYWNHDVEDNAYALMRDGKGCIAVLHSSATQWQHRFSLEIALTEGFLRLEGILSGSKSYGEEQLIVGRRDESGKGSMKEEVIHYLEDHSWSREIHEFADAIAGDRKIVTGKSSDALELMKTVYRIYWADPQWRKRFGIKNPDEAKEPEKIRITV